MRIQLQPEAMPDGYGETLIPLEAAKAHLRVEHDDEDALIGALRDAAIDAVEQYTGCFLLRRESLTARFEGFGPGMRPGKGPVATLSVTSVSYLDAGGAAVSLTPPVDGVGGDWRLDSGGGLIPAIGGSWPVSYDMVTVKFSAGFEEGACAPALISAAKMMLASLYTNREAAVIGNIVEELPLGFTMMCNPWRALVI